jgi:hypothetical protein
MQALLSPSAVWSRLVILCAILCCTSCSGSVAYNPVHGKVLFKDQPVGGVLVTFHPKVEEPQTILPVGQTQEDGTFTLTSGQNQGAPAGEYVVTFIWPEITDRPGKSGMTMQRFNMEDRFQGAYANRATSKIKIEIKNGTNELEAFILK